MNEEDKEAIELLKQEPDYSLSYYKREKAIDIVLNLIDKLQKENEELKMTITQQSIDISKQLKELDKKDKENKQLKNDNQVLRETLYGGNV